MEFINNIISSLINSLPFPINYGLLSVIIVAFLFMLFPFIGYIINKFEDMEVDILSKFFGIKFALFFVNRLTFLGVITHECAHASFAWIFGAKVSKIKLLTFLQENELGSVQFIPRGNKIKRHLQMFFTSCAPVIVNTFLSALIIYNFKNITAWYLYIIAIYLIISFMNHASMSKPYLDTYFKSGKVLIPFVIGVLFICMILFRQV